MRTKSMKLNQFEKNVKRFGHPKFAKGQKVITSVTGHDILTIQSEPWSNGFTWMYYFEENETGLGQDYITAIVPMFEGETHPQTKIGQIQGEIVAYQQLIAQLRSIKEPLRTNIIIRAIGECQTHISELRDWLQTEFLQSIEKK